MKYFLVYLQLYFTKTKNIKSVKIVKKFFIKDVFIGNISIEIIFNQVNFVRSVFKYGLYLSIDVKSFNIDY